MGNHHFHRTAALFKSLALIAALAASGLAMANTPVALDAGDFAAQRATIEKGLADGKTYAEISSADRGKVTDALARMSTLLDGGKTPDALAAEDKVDLYNQQEIVNTILTKAASDSRIVCTREVATGSHRKVTTCATYAERTRRRQQDQDTLSKSQRTILPLKD